MATVQRGITSHITHGNVSNTHAHLMTTNRWTPLIDAVSQELTGVTSETEHPNMEPASWKLTREEKLKLTTPMDACSLKLIW